MSFWVESKAEAIAGLFDEVVCDNCCSQGPYGWLGLCVLPGRWALLLAGVRHRAGFKGSPEGSVELHCTTDLEGDRCTVQILL